MYGLRKLHPPLIFFEKSHNAVLNRSFSSSVHNDQQISNVIVIILDEVKLNSKSAFFGSAITVCLFADKTPSKNSHVELQNWSHLIIGYKFLQYSKFKLKEIQNQLLEGASIDVFQL